MYVEKVEQLKNRANEAEKEIHSDKKEAVIENDELESVPKNDILSDDMSQFEEEEDIEKRKHSTHFCLALFRNQYLREIMIFMALFCVLALPTFFVTNYITQTEEKDEVSVKGCGITFPTISKWCQEFSSKHTRFFISQTSNFAHSLQELEQESLQLLSSGYSINTGTIQSIPSMAGAIGLFYNLDIPKLQLSREAVVGIFNGTITKWNDPLILQTNDIPMPSEAIIPFHFTLPKSTTTIFTWALSSFDEKWRQKFGSNESIHWNFTQNVSISNNEEMAFHIQSTKNSIGYSFLDKATSNLPASNLINKRNISLSPSIDTLNATLWYLSTHGNINRPLIDQNCDECYPIMAYSYFTMKRSYEKSSKKSIVHLMNFLEWVYSSSKASNIALKNFALTLPKPFSKIVMKDVDEIMSHMGTLENIEEFFPWEWAAVLIEFGIIFLFACSRLIYLKIKRRRQGLPKELNLNEPLLRKHKLKKDFDKTSIGQYEIRLTHRIGAGTHGEVFMGLFRGKKIACKRMLYNSQDSKKLKEFLSEASLMSSLRHPHIVQFLGACIRPPYLYILTELCSRGNLHAVLKNKKIHLSKKQLITMALHAAKGMEYLHSHKPPVIHRDLKTQNLLVSKNWTVKVGDFGLSRVIDSQKSMTYCGTVQICAPEVIKASRYSEKADVYSFAICLWEIMTREEAFKSLGPYEILDKVVSHNLRPPTDNLSPPELVQLLSECWSSNSADRPPFTEIINRLEFLKSQKKNSKLYYYVP